MKEAEVAAWGFTAADFEGADVQLWPENVDAFNVMYVMRRQWRMGPGGPVGLDYNVLPLVYEQVGVRRRHQRRVFEGVQVMEDAALEVMYA